MKIPIFGVKWGGAQILSSTSYSSYGIVDVPHGNWQGIATGFPHGEIQRLAALAILFIKYSDTKVSDGTGASGVNPFFPFSALYL